MPKTYLTGAAGAAVFIARYVQLAPEVSFSVCTGLSRSEPATAVVAVAVRGATLILDPGEAIELARIIARIVLDVGGDQPDAFGLALSALSVALHDMAATCRAGGAPAAGPGPTVH